MFSHRDFDVLQLAVGKPGEISLQLVCGGPRIEGLLRAHSSVIGMCREIIEAGTKSEQIQIDPEVGCLFALSSLHLLQCFL